MPEITINFSDEHNDYFTLTEGDESYEWHGRKGFEHNPDIVYGLIQDRICPNPGKPLVPWVSTHPKQQLLSDRLGITQSDLDRLSKPGITVDELRQEMINLFSRPLQ